MSDATLLGRGRLGRSLSLFGAAVLTWSVVAQHSRGELALWALVAAVAAQVAWILLVLLPLRWRVLPCCCLAVMVLAGATAAPASSGSALVPAAVAVLWVTREISRPLWSGLALGLATMVVIIVGDVLSPITFVGLIGLEVGVVVAFLAGQSRRQFLLAEYRSRELLEEQARTDVLSSRQQLAHDIHDVLAHSLGGLVIQLDAVEALLESGDAAAGAAKVRDARALAAEGMAEARRAVSALREPPADHAARVSGDRVREDAEALVDAHRSLGGRAALSEIGERHSVSEPLELALRRAVQEGLTNARKHAPGERVDVVLAWTPDAVELRIANPATSPTPTPGGHGLVGMRERFAALPGGSATAGVTGDQFVVLVKAATT